ncbi:translation initiation factor IF-2-like [Panicum virgatum]|uniref:translation initiation factor IF-2-like n=1 Tax=Panicum virgatum TaxID=38727 RepID=UPI0019D53BD6|nr:translation initiation factor IF-2-like [Panicum virgatum]
MADRANGGATTERSGSHGHMATESSEDTSPRPGEAPKGGQSPGRREQVATTDPGCPTATENAPTGAREGAQTPVPTRRGARPEAATGAGREVDAGPVRDAARPKRTATPAPKPQQQGHATAPTGASSGGPAPSLRRGHAGQSERR